METAKKNREIFWMLYERMLPEESPGLVFDSFLHEFVRKNTKHLTLSLGMPLYKGGERGLSVWQHLTDTYQTFTFLKCKK
jgi:hypothetical protein